ncbi:MAG: DUF3520 domain-containing protein [Clostridiales bacterium]|jgi:Ca-activated chloride channel family protein|nr:DUF3520 domain-containing protein [Clostridiales bacterium]
MNKRLLSLAVSLIMLFSCFVCAEAKPAQETAVEHLIELGVMEGYPDGSLGLEKPVTRAEFAKMIVLAASLTPQDIPKFVDVSETHWAYEYIGAAADAGIIGGFGDGTFKPDDNVTYEQAIKMVTLAFYYIKRDYPIGYISTAMDNGILDSIPAVVGEPATRGNTALLIYNAIMSKKEAAEIERLEELAIEKAEEEESYDYSGGGGSSAPMPGGGAASAPPPGIIAGTPSTGYFNTEEYTQEEENIFKNTGLNPLSTFSIDVDTASYSNMRRFILNGRFPTAGSIRTEELINYFDYDYPLPDGGRPFSVTTEVGTCPWNPDNKLALIAIKGDEIPLAERKPCNITFLIDTSGSMFSYNKLPLVKRSVALLVNQLNEKDTVSIVTYAGYTRVLLDSVRGSNKNKILEAVYGLNSYGSTAGASGINMAYDLATKNKIEGNNRIILCTDGDFNVGISSTAELEKLIEEKRESGIYLSVLGFGMGNYKDNRMETLADKGNGNYAYIDNIREAKKVLVDDMMKTLYTIAKDVKIQVEFNPKQVKEYRLVGYENRLLQDEDFEDDTKDAGELGAGHTVTALYELVMGDAGGTADLRYQDSVYKDSSEHMFVKLRYKTPAGSESILIEKPVVLSDSSESAGENFRFASAVAQFGMMLNKSEYLKSVTYDDIIEQAKSALGNDRFGLRAEFVQLVGLAKYIDGLS